MVSILDEIKNHKLEEVAASKQNRPEPSYLISEYEKTRPFVQALQSKNPAIIAEIKKASPSQGIIRENSKRLYKFSNKKMGEESG